MKLTHLDSSGRVQMVDVGHKPPLQRKALAYGFIRLSPNTLRLLKRKALPKGDALTTAQVAGIQAAKKTASLIPLCHTIPLDAVHIRFKVKNNGVEIQAEALSTAKTGVEMEALTAVSVTALTLYDMCKAVDRKISIGPILLRKKIKIPV